MSNSGSALQTSLFVDSLSIAGEIVDHPTLDDFLKLEDRLGLGQLVPFSLSRIVDRDSTMDFNVFGMGFSIFGAEDSVQRGTFGFSLLDLNKSSSPVLIGAEYCPEYCTTNDVNLVVAIARTFFLTGELDRRVTWHVARRGIGRPLETIPDQEILYAHNESQNLLALLSPN